MHTRPISLYFLTFFSLILFCQIHLFAAEKETPSESKKELRLSPPLIPTPQEYAATHQEKDKKSIGICGNGIVETGEDCDDGNIKNEDGCSSECKKEGKDIKTEGGSLCGNGEMDQGETCGESGLPTCPQGSTCRSCRCEQEAGVCGNGIAESGEQCGEPGLTCQAPLVCNGECQCAAAGTQCGFMSCPSNASCHVHYCRSANGGCTWDPPTSVNPSDSVTVQYDSGSLNVPECCVQISYNLSANFNPCSGALVPGTYQVQINSSIPISAPQCVCPIFEQGPGGGVYVDPSGNVVGCSESIDVNAQMQVIALPGDSPRIRIICADCCGNTKTVEQDLPAASPMPPVDCGVFDCPILADVIPD